MTQLLFIIALGYVGYRFIIKPFFIRPFQEGINEKEKIILKKRIISPEIAKEKGDKFQKYVVTKFDPAYFRMKEWRSDKYIDGLYPKSNLDPDLVYEFR